MFFMRLASFVALNSGFRVLTICKIADNKNKGTISLETTKTLT